jgi:protein-tyrosine phosphatase
MPNAKILFVCLGNICRSPMAEGIFRHMAAPVNAGRFVIDSAGTCDFHAGNPPDRRAQTVLRAKHIDISRLRARQVTADDFAEFDYILAMDQANLMDLQRLAPKDYKGCLKLFLDFAPEAGTREVPDPYLGDYGGFQRVFDMLSQASRGLLDELSKRDLAAQASSSSPSSYPPNG